MNEIKIDKAEVIIDKCIKITFFLIGLGFGFYMKNITGIFLTSLATLESFYQLIKVLFTKVE